MSRRRCVSASAPHVNTSPTILVVASPGNLLWDPISVQGALNFGIINSFGAYLSLSGVAILYARTGQLGLAQLSEAVSGHPADKLVVGAFVLICTGFLVKAAMVPFHFWLADAHAVARLRCACCSPGSWWSSASTRSRGCTGWCSATASPRRACTGRSWSSAR